MIGIAVEPAHMPWHSQFWAVSVQEGLTCSMTCWDIRHCPAVSPEEVNSQRPNLCCVVVCNCQLLGDRVGSDPYSKHSSAYMEEVKFQRPNLCCVVACNYQLLGDCVGKDFYSKYADIAWHSPIPPSPSLLSLS